MSHCRVNGTKAPSSVSGQYREKLLVAFLRARPNLFAVAGWLPCPGGRFQPHQDNLMYPWTFSLASHPRVDRVCSYYQQSSQESRIVPKCTEASRLHSIGKWKSNPISPQTKKKKKSLEISVSFDKFPPAASGAHVFLSASSAARLRIIYKSKSSHKSRQPFRDRPRRCRRVLLAGLRSLFRAILDMHAACNLQFS